MYFQSAQDQNKSHCYAILFMPAQHTKTISLISTKLAMIIPSVKGFQSSTEFDSMHDIQALYQFNKH
jgi:hypothetical protein